MGQRIDWTDDDIRFWGENLDRVLGIAKKVVPTVDKRKEEARVASAYYWRMDEAQAREEGII